MLSSINKDSKTMQAILATMIDGVIVVDYNEQITLANKAAENLFLVRSGVMQGRKLSGISNDSKISKMIFEVLHTGKEVFK